MPFRSILTLGAGSPSLPRMILSWRTIPVLFLAVASLCGLAAWAAEPISLAPEEGLLILQNGEVIRGKITQSGNRYYVALPGGELRLRASDVALRCKDLREGYEKKRAQLKGMRADEHLELAQWCLQHELLDEAATEVAQATLLDADHPRIRLMTRRLELAKAAPAATSVTSPMPAKTNDRQELDRQTNKLPPEVMQKFAATVQPLLMNSCATTGCHGVGAKSEFTLAKVRGQGERARRQTQRNLLAVLEQLDQAHPQESPLLVRPIEPHGGADTAIFTRQNSRQYFELYEWVRMATGDEAMNVAAGKTAPGGGPTANTDVEQVDFEAEVDADTTPDPFDPEEFNSQFGEAE